MSSLVITVKSARPSVADFAKDSTRPKEAVLALASYLQAAAGGCADSVIDVQHDTAHPVAASGTITLSGVAVDETVTIGGVTFTAKASPSGESQFSQAGTDTQDAASLAEKINAHSTLSKVVSATSALGVVTVTCRVKGVVGNFITLSETGSGMTVSGTTLTGGTGGATSAAKTYRCGL